MDFELPKINIADKFAIKYNDYYLTKIFFNITDDNWYTDRIDEIPDDLLFNEYNEADNCLLVICANHRLINKHVSIVPVRKVERED